MFVILLLYFMYCIYNMVMMFYFFFPCETEEHISIITILLTLKVESSTCIRRIFITRNINPFYVQRYTKKTLLMLSAQYGRHDFMKVLIFLVDKILIAPSPQPKARRFPLLEKSSE